MKDDDSPAIGIALPSSPALRLPPLPMHVTHYNPSLERVRAVCASLPDTLEWVTPAAITFRVGVAIFADIRVTGTGAIFGVYLNPEIALLLVVHDPRFSVRPGTRRCVEIRDDQIDDWGAIEELLRTSHDLNHAGRPDRPDCSQSRPCA